VTAYVFWQILTSSCRAIGYATLRRFSPMVGVLLAGRGPAARDDGSLREDSICSTAATQVGINSLREDSTCSTVSWPASAGSREDSGPVGHVASPGPRGKEESGASAGAATAARAYCADSCAGARASWLEPWPKPSVRAPSSRSSVSCLLCSGSGSSSFGGLHSRGFCVWYLDWLKRNLGSSVTL